MQELSDAFNDMAERLQESVSIISADRDRSREFVADVSHELRTPIAAMRTFNELLLEGAAEDPETREEFLRGSRQQLERLDWLAANLLELSKLDSGLVALQLRDEDLRTVAEDAVDHAEPMAERKGVELRTHLPETPVIQPHDPPRLGQVLGNLIGNAIKFTPKGGAVDVTVEATDDGRRVHRQRQRRRHRRRRARARLRSLLSRHPPARGARGWLRPGPGHRPLHRGHAPRSHLDLEHTRCRYRGPGHIAAGR